MIPLPFDIPVRAVLDADGFKSVPWWFDFRKSFDNLQFNDFYDTQFLSPTGLGSNAWGAFVADRPERRAPLNPSDYPAQDAQAWCEQAWDIGCDGFLMDIISASNPQDTQDITNNLEGALRATANGKPFEIMLGLDGATMSGTSTANCIAIVRANKDHPNAMRDPATGKLIVGSFAPEIGGQIPSRWATIKAGIAAGDAGVLFYPSYLNASLCTDSSWNAVADGAGVWGGNIFSTHPGLLTVADNVIGQGRKWCPSVWGQDYRPKEHMVREAGGSALYRLAFANAIAKRDATLANIMFLVTWNDLSENQMGPMQDGYGIQKGYYLLAAYFNVWFKTGAAPTINKDMVFYFHRIESTGAWLASGGTGDNAPSAYIHDPSSDPADAWQNNFEMVAFLAEGARMRISGITTPVTADKSAGLQTLTAPFEAGKTPIFTIERPIGTPVVTVTSAFTTRATSLYQNLLYHAGNSDAVAPSIVHPALGRSQMAAWMIDT